MKFQQVRKRKKVNNAFIEIKDCRIFGSNYHLCNAKTNYTIIIRSDLKVSTSEKKERKSIMFSLAPSQP